MKRKENPLIFAAAQGEMAEWSNAAVLKTVEGHTSGGSNPSFSADEKSTTLVVGFLISIMSIVYYRKMNEIKK